MDRYNYTKYVCEYAFNGEKWGITIEAKSVEEAQERLRKIGYGKVPGTLKAEIPYQLGWFAKNWVWFQQFTTGTKPPPTS